MLPLSFINLCARRMKRESHRNAFAVFVDMCGFSSLRDVLLALEASWTTLIAEKVTFVLWSNVLCTLLRSSFLAVFWRVPALYGDEAGKAMW